MEAAQEYEAIGEENGEKRLYVEDYVVTYLNRLADEKDVARAILIGTVKERNLYPYIFIRWGSRSGRLPHG